MAAFEEIVAAHQQKIYTVAFRILENGEDAADVAQETFIRVYRSLANFKGDASLSTWIYRITVNLCKDALRKRGHLFTQSLDEPVSEESESLYPQLADDRPLPEELYEQQELKAYLEKFIACLSPDYRIVVVMREQMELSYEEISRQLGISLGTVKSRLNRARKYLRESILKDREQEGKLLRLKDERRG
ncbi:MAG: sigma-70 family RNA polymerase sigma factor [Peptococcaceae bacterium]|nr:sigma-70 family RNA polymerase sigma factor [Peptococcaceae bacterium]